MEGRGAERSRAVRLRLAGRVGAEPLTRERLLRLQAER